MRGHQSPNLPSLLYNKLRIHGKYPLCGKDQLVPSYLTESYMLVWGKQTGRKPACLKPLIIHYISSTLPVEELHDLTCLAYKNIDLPVSRVAPGLPNLAAHYVDSYTHVGRSIGNEKLIVLVEIKHKAVNFRQRSEIYSL